MVALCFVTVLGIVLASYIAVCSNAMNLSNRAFQSNLSQQLAEFALEEGLRAFNKGNWNSWTNTPTGMTAGAWSLDTTTKRATRTITFNSGKLGQGATGTVKIRIDNYDAAQLASAWQTSAVYSPNDVVSYSNGNWYRCLTTHTSSSSNEPPNMNYWVSAGVPWQWVPNKSYSSGNIVYHNNSWYRYTSGTATTSEPPSSRWTPITSMNPAWPYSEGSVRNDWGDWQLFSSGSWSAIPLTWQWQPNPTKPYAVNDVVCYNGVWYRCVTAHSSSWSYTPGSSSYWRTPNYFSTWAAGTTYNLNDAVSVGGIWYRSKTMGNLGNTPSATSSYWSVSPIMSVDWDAKRQYSQYDTVRYNGVWYLSLTSNNTARNPSTATTYWIGANTTNSSYIWNTTTAYAANAYRCYGGVWYQAVVANTNQSPNNTTYWTSSWRNSSRQIMGAPIIYAESIVTTPRNPPNKTQLRAVISPAPLFPNAVGSSVTSTFDVSTTGTVDSYDSQADPSVASPGYSAVVAGLGTSSAVVSSGSATINGYVAAPTSSGSPTTPLFTYSTTAVVKGTPTVPSTKVDLARVSRSPYVPQFAINSVSGGALLTTGTTIGTPGATTPSVFYYPGDLELNGTSTSITIIGPVILNIQGRLRIRGSAKLTIAATGSAEIHISSYFRVYSDGSIDNQTNDPKKCVVLCTAATGTHYYRAPSPAVFCGVMYFPDEDLAIDGTSAVILGAISARNVTLSNSITFHYDTSLRNTVIAGVDQPYAITHWRELPVTEQATMP